MLHSSGPSPLEQELLTRLRESDAWKANDRRRVDSAFELILLFVLASGTDAPAGNAISTLAFLGTLPILRNVTADYYFRMSDDRLKCLLRRALCIAERHLRDKKEPIATDADWFAWFQAF